MPSFFEKLSIHLRTQDPDAMAWADGRGHEIASELLEQFTSDDWDALSRAWRLQSKAWRTCLAQILYPKDATASAVLLDMTADPDIDVCFAALRVVSFYCGVNARADGPFLDERIRIPGFLALAAERAALMHLIERIGAQCAPHFRRQFELLAAQLVRQRNM